MFAYACTESPAYPGLPSFELHTLQPNEQSNIAETSIRVLPLLHGRMTVYGFLFGRDLAYVTDCNAVSADVIEAIRGVTVLVLDALRYRPHPTHLTIDQACEVAGQVGAKLTLFTHLSHDVDHEAVEKELPPQVRVAYDGMQIEVADGAVRQMA